MQRPVYLDHHATTPMDPKVGAAMRPYCEEAFAHPGAGPFHGATRVAEALELARSEVAGLIGGLPGDVVFTSGGTEANNLALKGAAAALADRGDRIVTLATEHASVLETCRRLARDGFEVTVLPVRPDGLVDLERLAAAIDERTILVSVMHGHNEIGVIQPVREIARLAAARGALFHTDAVASAALVRLDVVRDGLDLVTLSGHALHGPKGVGALYVRRQGVAAGLARQLEGGVGEWGLRPGTPNVPGIVGFGAACRLAREIQGIEPLRLADLRNHLWGLLEAGLDRIRLNGVREPRLPNNLSVTFEGVDGERLLSLLDDVAVSNGAAAWPSTGRPSATLLALGLSETAARATLRFGLGRFTTVDEVEHAAWRTVAVVERLRLVSGGCGLPHAA